MNESDTSQPAQQQNRSDIRFSPAFSVDVLPPDTVCLYSEGRKLFLRGELYCALASRIGAGESQAAIVAELSRQFPPQKINEALEALSDRGFIMRAGIADGAAASYWTSLGLLPRAAAENLRQIRLQVISMAGPGASELESVLREFGVRVVDSEPDLTVVLVEDYLDERLAEFNRQQITKKQDWLPVQLTGTFPLVGPIFSPGKSACWACLAERLKKNRPIKEFLDRKQARRVAVSPLEGKVLAQNAIGVAAVEIGKAIATGFRTELHQHVVSLEVLGSTVARHHVGLRPQCPVCGGAALRDPARPPAPPRLRVGGKSVMTSGGYRAVSPLETVARFRRHVSPLTGIVSRLERMKSDQPLDESFVARHNRAARPETVEALQASLGGESYGSGSTAEQGEASALMKAIERHCGMFAGDEIRLTRRFTDFAAGEAIAPNDVTLWSDGPSSKFDAKAEIEWSPVWSLRDERFKHLPTDLLYSRYASAGRHAMQADGDGCAAGNNFEEAILQGFLELVERDACAIWWYNRLQRPEIDLAKLGDSFVEDLRDSFAAAGRSLWALDVTSDLGIPVAVALLHWTEDGREHLEYAAGAHFDPRIATLKAVTKLNQHLASGRTKRRSGTQPGHDIDDAMPIRKQAWLQPHGKASLRRTQSAKFTKLDRRDQVRACTQLAAGLGLDLLVLDQTRPDIEAPVARVIVPGLRPFAARFAPGRLYDVPLALRLRKRRLREADLNPLHPRS